MSSSSKPRRRITRFLLDDVSKRAHIVKLQTEISLLDNELETLQCQFGIAFYDTIEAAALSSSGGGGEVLIMESFPDSVATAYHECKALIGQHREEQSKRHDAIDSHQSQRMRAAAPTTLTERVMSLANGLTSHSADAKLKVENLWLERQVVREKQVFGRLIFSAVIDLKDNALLMGHESLQLLIAVTADRAAEPLQRKAEKMQLLATLEAAVHQAWVKEETGSTTPKNAAEPVVESLPTEDQ